MLVPFEAPRETARAREDGRTVDIRDRAEDRNSGAGAADLRPYRTIVLVGLMGAGKTKIGRRLAARLDLPFFDSDTEIETAAGETIEEIFRNRGEGVFRDGERRVIARLLDAAVHVLATGGGAFMDAATRALIARARRLGLAARRSRCAARAGGAAQQPAAAARRAIRAPCSPS